ncbi:transcription antitermination factor NusB [Endozoicomonadaceae bacterium StTr2]
MSSKSSEGRFKPAARRKARQMALQAVYQWQMSGNALLDIETQFRAHNDMTKVDGGYFHSLLHGVAREASRLDDELAPYLDRTLDQLDPVEKAALRIGSYELMFHQEVPYRVIINEAIELTKLFGAQDSHRYINGILDRLAPKLRADETRKARQR